MHTALWKKDLGCMGGAKNGCLWGENAKNVNLVLKERKNKCPFINRDSHWLSPVARPTLGAPPTSVGDQESDLSLAESVLAVLPTVPGGVTRPGDLGSRWKQHNQRWLFTTSPIKQSKLVTNQSADLHCSAVSFPVICHFCWGGDRG